VIFTEDVRNILGERPFPDLETATEPAAAPITEAAPAADNAPAAEPETPTPTNIEA